MVANHYHPLPTHAWADSDSIFLKKDKYLKTGSLPTIDEIRLNIGSQLSDIFFSQASDGLKECMFFEKKLEGPKEQMWVSPSDQLIGKLVLTEPYPRQESQAINHENILEIGEKIEEKYAKERKEELKSELLKKEQEVRKEMEEKLNKQIDEVRTEMEGVYRNRLQYMKKQLSDQFQEMMEERDKILCKRAEKKTQEALAYLRKSMAEEMELISRRKLDYNEEVNKFNRIWDANKANEEFRKKVNNLKKKWIKILKKARKISEVEKKDIKDKFIEYHANELERLKETCDKQFDERLHKRTYNYRRTICDLLKQIKKKEEEYEKLRIEKECVHVEQYSWCFLVRELLTQFQKFINFALMKKAGHAEYLLSLEKLLHNRIKSLTEVEFLRKYIEENGSHLIDERLMAEDARLRINALKEIKVEEQVKEEYPCLPEDKFGKRNKKKTIDTNETVQEIQDIIDKIIGKAVPRLTELPCIDSDVLSSGKSEGEQVAWPADPKPPGLYIVGDGVSSPPATGQKFTEDRVTSLVKALNRHPGIKLAIIGVS